MSLSSIPIYWSTWTCSENGMIFWRLWTYHSKPIQTLVCQRLFWYLSSKFCICANDRVLFPGQVPPSPKPPSNLCTSVLINGEILCLTEMWQQMHWMTPCMSRQHQSEYCSRSFLMMFMEHYDTSHFLKVSTLLVKCESPVNSCVVSMCKKHIWRCKWKTKTFHQNLRLYLWYQYYAFIHHVTYKPNGALRKQPVFFIWRTCCEILGLGQLFEQIMT